MYIYEKFESLETCINIYIALSIFKMRYVIGTFKSILANK